VGTVLKKSGGIFLNLVVIEKILEKILDYICIFCHIAKYKKLVMLNNEIT
jgi:hypothetical protein